MEYCHCDIAEPWVHYATWNKDILYNFTHMWIIKNKQNKSNKNKHVDTENRAVSSHEKVGGMVKQV